MKYYHRKEADVIIGVENEPGKVLLNSNVVSGWEYNRKEKSIKIKLPKGEGSIVFQ